MPAAPAPAKHPYPGSYTTPEGEQRAAPEQAALNVLGHKWALPILAFVLDHGPVRFVTIQRSLGLSTEQLRTNVNRLVDHGVLKRTRYREVPPRVEYEVTDAGRDARLAIAALSQWGLTHGKTGGRP